MTVYILSKAYEDYNTEYETYGVFSSFDNAAKYAKSIDKSYPVEGIDEVTNRHYVWWSIDEWVIDELLEEL